jgi:hypothetical protein
MERDRIIHDLGITRFVGVYQADGGWRGELAYVAGKVIGRAHCALCDVTHSPVRRKASWDRFVAQLPVPFELVHLNERPPSVLDATRGRTPIVVAERQDGTFLTVVDAAALEAVDGSVDDFARALEVGLRMCSP